MAERPHPFRELRARPHIRFVLDDHADEAGGAIYAIKGGRAVIVISPDLTPEARQCALAHELVHDEIGVVQPPATDATMQRIENIVDRRADEWLVPIDALAAWAARRAELSGVEAWMVAEEWGVTDGVARRVLARLLEREMARAVPPTVPPMDAPGRE